MSDVEPKDLPPETLLFLKSLVGITKKGKIEKYEDIGFKAHPEGHGFDATINEALDRLIEQGIVKTCIKDGKECVYLARELTPEENLEYNMAKRVGRAGFRYKNIEK
jgi:hypothetical protein